MPSKSAVPGMSSTPSIRSMRDFSPPGDTGAKPTPQLPITTVVMGNCGVGFAPVSPGGEKSLIDLMEGVEDIPGTALFEGMPWGAWETFPEYLEFLDTRSWTADVSAQLAHGALRFYVMG